MPLQDRPQLGKVKIPPRMVSPRTLLSFLQEEHPPHPASAARDEVTLLSWDRWGVGSLVTIAVLLGGGVLLLFRWTGTKGLFSLTMAVILLVGAGVIFVVKAAENIERTEFGGYDPVGKTGVVTAAVERSTGFVRVDGMEWSAKSTEALELGAKVVVVSRDGLYVSVERAR